MSRGEALPRSLVDREPRASRAATSASRERWNELVREHQSGLLRYARQLLGGDASLAEDVVQEAFCALFRRSDDEPPIESVSAWLYRVTRNRALDVIRKESRMKQREGEAAIAEPILPEATLEEAERDREISRALSQLDPRMREVLVLKIQGNRSYREIAEILELSLASVSRLVHQGLAHVARGLRAADVL